MKFIVFIFSLFCFNPIFCQFVPDSVIGVDISKLQRYSETDTVPIVRMENTKVTNNVIWYVNGEQVDDHIISNLNLDHIENLEIFKDTVRVKNQDYFGKIVITLKDDININWISLSELNDKYLYNPQSRSVLFMINGKAVDKDYNSFFVDEYYILKLQTQEVVNSNLGLDLLVVEIVFRTKENLKKANMIRIKGDGIID